MGASRTRPRSCFAAGVGLALLLAGWPAPTWGEVVVDARQWHEVDEGVETRGLDVRFAMLDAEVEIWEGGKAPGLSIGKPKDVVLTDEWQTFTVEEGGAVFEVRLRATGSAVGAELELSLRRNRDRSLIGGQLEAEDERLLGAWIEVESARLHR